METSDTQPSSQNPVPSVWTTYLLPCLTDLGTHLDPMKVLDRGRKIERNLPWTLVSVEGSGPSFTEETPNRRQGKEKEETTQVRLKNVSFPLQSPRG